MNIEVTRSAQRDISYALRKAALKLSDKIVTEEAENATFWAYDLYAEAKYDGTIDDIIVDVKKTKSGECYLYAEGPQVRAIEYGSGDLGEKPASGNLLISKEGNFYWFYITPSGNEYKAGGAPKKVPGKRYAKDPDDPRQGWFASKKEAIATWKAEWEEGANADHNKMFLQDYPNAQAYIEEHLKDNMFYRKSVFTGLNGKKMAAYTRSKSEIEESGLIDSKRYSFTRGNEPNHTLKKTLEKMVEDLKRKYG